MVDDVVKTLSIKNLGKYKISYSFASKTSVMRELFTMTPDAADIDPGKEQVVQVGLTHRCHLGASPLIVGGLLLCRHLQKGPHASAQTPQTPHWRTPKPHFQTPSLNPLPLYLRPPNSRHLTLDL